MAYERLNLVNKVDKWKAEHVTHLEDGIVELENRLDNDVLPDVDTSDNGKMLQVVNGEWTAVEIPESEEYDGIVTIDDNATLINFTIDDVSYQAEEGMTWGEWQASEYNTVGVDTSILLNTKFITPSNSIIHVNNDTQIIDGQAYITRSNASGGGIN